MRAPPLNTFIEVNLRNKFRGMDKIKTQNPSPVINNFMCEILKYSMCVFLLFNLNVGMDKKLLQKQDTVHGNGLQSQLNRKILKQQEVWKIKHVSINDLEYALKGWSRLPLLASQTCISYVQTNCLIHLYLDDHLCKLHRLLPKSYFLFPCDHYTIRI